MCIRVIALTSGVLSVVMPCSAQTESVESLTKDIAELAGTQQKVEMPVQIVDAKGRPVSDAKVIPWALRSSQGHGLWREDDKRAGFGPQSVITDEQGKAEVRYPYFRDVKEKTRTLAVSLRVDHPEFAFRDKLHIDVPLESSGPHQIELTPGIRVDVRPLLDGKPAGHDNLYALWSDGRSWIPGVTPQKRPDGTLRIPALPPGENSILLAMLEGERVTHFSEIIDFELTPGEPKKLDAALRPSLRIKGVLSDNVPRPVRDGRIKAWTLNPASADFDRVEWFTWAPIRPDGTFTIDGWPGGERIQLIALCDGYIATSGAAPDVVVDPPDPDKDSFNRPQVFDPAEAGQLTVEMTPLSRCVATAVDEDGEPVAGVTVVSWPNVGWWNIGSQIYCHPLVRSERRLKKRDYHSAVDDAFSQPFQTTTDARGMAMLELPIGKQRLAVRSDVFELPAFLGKRHVEVNLAASETTGVDLRLQPRGTDNLGEWDKLAGVVFGCSTREGRRICALPGVRNQMDEITRKFREAENPRDPQLLAETYSAIADAFEGVGDQVEAAKWRQKSRQQAAKAGEEQ